MCGITGIFHFNKERIIDKQKLIAMTNIIRHRGPDGDGFHVGPNIGLGHRRLSIIDLSTGDQPMFNDDRSIALVLNGEIYNYIELKDDLRKLGYKFKTNSDTEVVIRSYEQWGVDCQNKFNGMWAFALWDSNKQQLFISRDRIGEKPLHYAIWDNTLLFGSEIKSLFEYGLPKEQQLEFLEIYAVLKCIPEPYSFFRYIKKLMPGHYILANVNGYTEYCYWDLPDIDENNLLQNKKSIYDEFSSLLGDSVKIRMRSDVPFGAFLSGGLDSSSIVALMSEISSFPVSTFTIGYDETEFDESGLASLVARKFGTEHFVGKIQQANFEETLQKIVFHYDEPFGDSSAIPTGYVSKFAAEHVKMVLTGDGGDEVLSGYPSYQGVKFAQKYHNLPTFIQQIIPPIVDLFSTVTSGEIKYKLNRYHHLFNSSQKDFTYRLLDKRAKPDMSSIRLVINPEIQTWKVEDYLHEFMQKCHYKDDFYKLMYLNFKFDLPNDYLVKVDRMSMAHSLETRLPFLDYRLIEFMVRVNKDVKMQGWERKSILKNTIGKKLPLELLKAPKKGFRVPVRDWFKSKELQNSLVHVISNCAFINPVIFSQLVKDNRTGKADHGNLLWSLIVLSKIFNG